MSTATISDPRAFLEGCFITQGYTHPSKMSVANIGRISEEVKKNRRKPRKFK